MSKKECNKCGYSFSTRAGNYTRHFKACNGSYEPYVKGNIRECKHCRQEFDISTQSKSWMANHSRWCRKNPKRHEYVDNLIKNNAGENRIQLMNEARKKSGIHNQFEKARIEGKPIPVVSEETKEKMRLASSSRTHTEETKQIMKEKALASKHRRLKKNVVEYNGVLLDSSWELELAKRLDNLNIIWVRPDPIPWVDEEGVIHNYFPDFYLPEYDRYLDPKNKHAIRVQESKLKILLTQYTNIDIIDSLEGCRRFSI